MRRCLVCVVCLLAASVRAPAASPELLRDLHDLGEPRVVEDVHYYYPTWLPDGFDAVSVAIGDIDGDGRGEVVYASSIGRADVLRWGEAGLQVVASGLRLWRADWRSFDLGDVDGDGREELVISLRHPLEERTTVVIYQWRQGSFAKLLETSVVSDEPNLPVGCVRCLADLDQNGRAEILISRNNSVDPEEWLLRYEMAAGGLRALPGSAFISLGESVTIAGDLLGEGRPQLLCGIPEFWSHPNAGWQHGEFRLIGWSDDAQAFEVREEAYDAPTALLHPLACVAGNTRPLVVGRAGHHAHLLWRDEDGWRWRLPEMPERYRPHRGAVLSPGEPRACSDLDGNGNPDLAFVAGHGELVLWTDIVPPDL